MKYICTQRAFVIRMRIPSHVVELKGGTPIILIRSIETPHLLNGTRLIITTLFEKVIAATLSSVPYASDEVSIPRIPLTAADHDIPIQRLQFPVTIIYATISTNRKDRYLILSASTWNAIISHVDNST